MFLIVGLGNPEEKYEKTRHNMGFNTIDKIAKKYNIEFDKNKFEGIYGIGSIYGEKVILLKPQTYMNLSGRSLAPMANFYKVDIQNIIVIYDDMDIEVGAIKLRKKGGPGSHNGMKSVVEELNSTDFPRVRVGIGKPEFKNDTINYVIGKMPEEEFEKLDKSTQIAADAVVEVVKNGIDTAMNKYN